MNNHRVQVFQSTTGDLIRSIGHGLQYPSDVCIYNDMIYISDGNNHRVQVLTLEGVLVMLIGNHGEVSCRLHCPSGICCYEDRSVVCVRWTQLSCTDVRHKWRRQWNVC
jgi:hypothetical protein